MKCQNNCYFDKVRQVCSGCGRTIEQIKQAYYEQVKGTGIPTNLKS